MPRSDLCLRQPNNSVPNINPLCSNCGHDNKKTAKFCVGCGAELDRFETKPKLTRDVDLGKLSLGNIFSKKQPESEFPTSFSYRGMNRYKSEGTTLVLSLYIGLLGFMGVGHRYVGNVKRSLIIFGIGVGVGFLWLTIWLPLATLGLGQPFAVFTLQIGIIQLIPYSSDPLFVQIRAFVSMATYVAVPVGYYTFLIWQIFDAKKQCRKFNLHMDESGEQLWKVTTKWKIIYGIGLASPFIIGVQGYVLLFILPLLAGVI